MAQAIKEPPPFQVGDRLRVDGSLMGVDVKSPGLIPGWKRGHFSLVMDGSGCGTQESVDGAGAGIALGDCGSGSMDAAGSTRCSDGGPATPAAAAAPRLLFLHHGKQRWVDLGADKKAMKAEESAALEEELLAALERWGRGLGRRSRPLGTKIKGLGARTQPWQAASLGAGGKGWSCLGGVPSCIQQHPPPRRRRRRRDVDKQRFKVRGFRFEPLRGWLGGEVREKVEGWACRVYEAAGKLVGVATSKAAWQLEGGAAFEDYLALDPPDDDVAEAGFDPLNPGSYDPSSGRAARGGDADYAEAEASAVGREEEEEEEQDAAALGEGEGGAECGGGSSKSGSGAAWGGGGAGTNGRADPDANVRVDDGAAGVEAAPSPQSRQRQRTRPGLASQPPRQRSPSRKGKAGGRTLRARLWMASGFPMRLSELVPLLGVVGAANKQIARVGRFMARYSGLDLFPVRIQVPLLLTVYAVVGFSAFKELTPADAPGPEFFQVRTGGMRVGSWLCRGTSLHAGAALGCMNAKPPRRRRNPSRQLRTLTKPCSRGATGPGGLPAAAPQ